jgi:uncharacterized protein YndB with AHSA1/START domain
MSAGAGARGSDTGDRVICREILRPERPVYDHDGDDDSSDHRFHVTATFTALGARTGLRFQLLFTTTAARDRTLEFGAVEGGRQTLDQHAEYPAGN